MLGKTQSVSEITNKLSSLIESNLAFKNLAIEGQISNLSFSSVGHIYFNLIDENSLINCAFFKYAASRSSIKLEEGMSLLVCGDLSLYKPKGSYQIIVKQVLLSKESYMQKLFLELKSKLEKKGYFDVQRKRALPKDIRKVGLITSKTSAAIRDFLTTLKPRNPFIEIYLIDVRVQGNTAPQEISNAIKEFQKYDDVDLIVITRGGGSKDELFLFNDEIICDAAFESRIPILSAVGHEIDKSLLDYTADIYCSTPTAAAQRISDNLYISINTLPQKIKNLENAYKMRFSYERMNIDNKLKTIESYLVGKIRQGKLQLSQYNRALEEKVKYKISSERLKLEQAEQLLKSYNVNNVLSRGFAIVKKDGEAIASSNNLNINDSLEIEMQDYILNVKLEDIIKK